MVRSLNKIPDVLTITAVVILSGIIFIRAPSATDPANCHTQSPATVSR